MINQLRYVTRKLQGQTLNEASENSGKVRFDGEKAENSVVASVILGGGVGCHVGCRAQRS